VQRTPNFAAPPQFLPHRFRALFRLLASLLRSRVALSPTTNTMDWNSAMLPNEWDDGWSIGVDGWDAR